MRFPKTRGIAALAILITTALPAAPAFGAGFAIILTRPFVVGDTITIKKHSGVVEEIKLGMTQLITEDNELINIPNKQIVGEILVNSFGNRVVETAIGISHSDDPQKAIDIVTQTLNDMEQVVSEPAPQVGIQELTDYSINIGMRYWVPTRQYFQSLCAINLAIYNQFRDAGITLAHQQRDIYVYGEESDHLRIR